MCFSFLLSKKGVSKKFSNYQPIASISCPSKAFEIIINMKVFIHLSASDLTEHQQVLLNRLFTGNNFAATVKPLLLPQTSRKGLIESGTNLCLVNYPFTNFFPFFILLFLISTHTDQSLL